MRNFSNFPALIPVVDPLGRPADANIVVFEKVYEFSAGKLGSLIVVKNICLAITTKGFRRALHGNQPPIYWTAVTCLAFGLPSSPAIDAGITLPGFSYDIEGTPRSQGNGWDIGAYEFTDRRLASPKNLRIIGQQ